MASNRLYPKGEATLYVLFNAVIEIASAGNTLDSLAMTVSFEKAGKPRREWDFLTHAKAAQRQIAYVQPSSRATDCNRKSEAIFYVLFKAVIEIASASITQDSLAMTVSFEKAGKPRNDGLFWKHWTGWQGR